MVGGWHDIFLPWQLADYRALRAAGARPYLTIGSWHHGSLGLYRDSLRESIQWLRAHLYGEAHPLRAAPVRVHIGGTRHWRDFADWPPPARTTDWFLRSGGGLSRSAPGAGAPDRFVYDPACPTPAVGGARLAGHLAGVRDNRALEARADVLTYTSDPLAYPIEVAGPVRATVFVRSSLPYFDVFVRLCDVRPNGRSDNVCDGLLRVAPGNPDAAGGVRPVEVDLWPTAYRFAAGNRLRVQISGGAHPRFARNPGTGAPLGAAGPLRSSVREVFATDTYPSAIHLPVLT
jgi:putative CocE/NonD family hydrolase